MSRARRLLPYVLVLAFVLRLVAAVLVERHVTAAGRRFLVEGDANGYWDLAENLLGGTFAVHDPPRYALRMPGFPTLIATGMLTTGGSRFGVRIWLAAVGTLACGLVFLLGRELLDETTGLVAAAVTAVVPAYVGLSVLVLSETTFAAAMLACLWGFAVLMRDDERPRYEIAFVAGLLASVAVYVRPAWLLAVPAFVLIDVLVSRRRRVALSRGGIVILGVIVALAPWTIRNALVLGHFVPTTTWLGPTLYDGLSPTANGDSDMQFYEDDREAGRHAGRDEYEIDRDYRDRSWAFVREHPGTALALAGRKQVRFWSPWLNAPGFDSMAARLGMLVFSLPLLVLAAVGAWVLRDRPRAFWATVGPLLYFAILHTVFVGSVRYRLPAEYPLWVAAAAGLLAWWPGLRDWLEHPVGQPSPQPEGAT